MDRLTRQVADLRTENNELRQEIAHYDTELREVRERNFVAQEEVSDSKNQNSIINYK